MKTKHIVTLIIGVGGIIIGVTNQDTYWFFSSIAFLLIVGGYEYYEVKKERDNTNKNR